MMRARLTLFWCALLTCLTLRVYGTCPSNGDPRVLYVTANGDRGFSDILMIDTFGHAVGTAINWTSVPETVVMLKLRGMALSPDGRLYVAVALGAHSKIVAFHPSLGTDCTLQFDRVVAQVGPGNRYLKHPYGLHLLSTSPLSNASMSISINDDDVLLSANQNSASVTWMSAHDGAPLPSLISNGTRGLFAIGGGDPLRRRSTSDSYSLSSVRGISLTPDSRWLLLADVDADVVKVFDTRSGALLWDVDIPTPIQIALAPPGFLNLDGRHPDADRDPHALVTTKTDCVYIVRIARPHPSSLSTGSTIGAPQQQSNVKVFACGFRATSGIAFDAEDGVVFIADRVDRTIHRLRFDGERLEPRRWGPKLLDEPEHLLFRALADPRTFPHCYEMGPMGLKYSVICVAGYGWLIAALIGIALVASGTVKVVV